MEPIYAVGVTAIELTQYWLADWENYFAAVNQIVDPNNIVEILFPIMSIIDSVLASELLLCMAFGGWCCEIVKLIMLEDRPYWWVKETTFYVGMRQPILKQTIQTCETSAGSPSGHTVTAAMLMSLFTMWIAQVLHDRKINIMWWLEYIIYIISCGVLGSVVLSRTYIAAHFPHQCLISAVVGMFIAPALCLHVSDPYIWRSGQHATVEAVKTHVAEALGAILLAFVSYYSLLLTGYDPQGTVKLALRWCENPDHVHVSTTPIFSMVQCTANLLGWALCVTPAIAQYRHETKNRSIIISAITTAAIIYGFKQINDNISKANPIRYHLIQFVLACLKPMLLLRVAPAIAMWPFEKPKDKEE